MSRFLFTWVVALLPMCVLGQTTVVGPADQYVFQFEDPLSTSIGLHYSLFGEEFQFLNASGSTLFSLDSQTGDAVMGEFGNYSSFSGMGNMTMRGGADYLIDNYDYVFRTASIPNLGLYYEHTNNRFEFRNILSNPIFWISTDASTSNPAGSFHAEGTAQLNHPLITQRKD